jgi:hypothetical protein
MMPTPFEEFVASVPARAGPFVPFVFENEGGSVEVFLDDEMFYGEHVSPHLTLHVGERSGRLVGFEVTLPAGLRGKR